MTEPTTPLQPRDALELQLQRIWEDLLDHRPIGVDADFFSIGGDSIQAMTLMARIVQETGLRLPMSGLMQATTIEKLAVALRQSSDAKSWSPLVPLQVRAGLPALYCVHPVGGNVLCYLQLARELAGDLSLYGLQSPGIDGLREPAATVNEMVQEYLAAIKKLQPQGPYLLCGWSFGGIIAYQMARELRAAGDEVRMLALIDSGHLYSFAVMLTFFRGDSRDMWSRLNSSDDEQITFFREHTAQAQLIPPNADDALAQQIYRTVIANMRALMDFHLKPYEGEIVLFRARDKYIHTRHTPEDEWRRLCETVTVVPTAGNHLSVIHEPHVAELAAHIREQLAAR